MDSDFRKYLLRITKATNCHEVEVIQSLWSGYGKIARYSLKGSNYETVVVKHINPNQQNNHPRGWNTNIGHQRKVKSYKVETQWYEHWSGACGDTCRVPKFLGSYYQGEEQWIVLEDLNTEFPLRKQEVSPEEIKVCLQWLAHFHATFLNQKPKDLWEIGTYWHLATRPDEFEKIEHAELKAKAHLIDKKLNQCKYQTIVHGDAKLANFCFTEEGDAAHASDVAGVDFQYVGGSCGMKDVAYFLGSCLSGQELAQYEKELIAFYFMELRKAISTLGEVNFLELENEWRQMYPLACADFTRFLLGWMPSHQKINAYQLNLLASVLAKL